MPDKISWFAYDEMMNPEVMKEKGLEYYDLFCVTLSAFSVKFNKIPLDNGGLENLGLANIVPTESNLGMMDGILYEMDSRFLPILDEMHHVPDEYIRKKMRFTKHDFNFVNAYTYVAQKHRTQDGLLPSKDTMKKIKACRRNLSMLYFCRMMNTPTVGGK